MCRFLVRRCDPAFCSGIYYVLIYWVQRMSTGFLVGFSNMSTGFYVVLINDECRCAGKLMCRFLFRRCDPEPAPWETGDKGDGAWGDLPPEAVEEMNRCKEKVHKCGEDAFWAWREAKGEWGWVKAPPAEASAPGKGPAKGQSLVGQLKKKVAQVCASEMVSHTVVYHSNTLHL